MTHRRGAAFALLVAALAVSGCARIIPRPATGGVIIAPPPVAPPVIANALAAGVVAADPPVFDSDQAVRALAAFRLSCPSLLRRNDDSGLTRPADWASPCRDADAATDPVRFFETAFDPVRIGPANAFATGYYEPEIAGSRVAGPDYPAAIYRKPPDLVEQPSVQCPPDFPTSAAPSVPPCKRAIARGRMVDGVFQPYFDRAAIEDGALVGRGLEIAYAADPVELFFLQVQGSGRLRLPDGGVMRIGYDGQNGYDYTGIGKLMKDRGLLAPGQASMQGIMAYLRANPEEGRAIMRENKSWVFFRELTGAGPLGALNVPVTPRATVAADVMFVPLGAPVVLSMDRPEASGLWIAQDTGGAIKGANRFDTFWGAGEDARTIAGGMSARGSAVLLLPRGTLARLAARRAAGQTP